MKLTKTAIPATKLALLQSKFHRNIKHRVTAALKPLKLSSVDWVILGLLEHKKKPMAVTAVAAELGIQTSFMATVVAKLAARKLVTLSDDTDDRRKKLMALTSEGRAIVKEMQEQFTASFLPVLEGLTLKDLESYLKVLTTVIDNTERSERP